MFSDGTLNSVQMPKTIVRVQSLQTRFSAIKSFALWLAIRIQNSKIPHKKKTQKSLVLFFFSGTLN
jgi:hypothetical protein